MRLVLIWGDKHPGTKSLFDTLKRDGHTVEYWVGVEGGKKYSAPGAIFHDHEDAWAGRPAKGYEAWMVPPPASLIEELYSVESVTLTMMDKRFDIANVTERTLGDFLVLHDEHLMRRFPTHGLMSFLLMGITTRTAVRRNGEPLRDEARRVSQREMFDLGDELQRAASAVAIGSSSRSPKQGSDDNMQRLAQGHCHHPACKACGRACRR